ncbi:triple tyrosine motif-containing protein [Bacillus cereus]|nr:triple tyrosine motif-containing protein [Bacillus cereus]
MFKKVFVPLFAATVLISGCNKEVAKDGSKDKLEQQKAESSIVISEVNIDKTNERTLKVDVKAKGEDLNYAYYIYKEDKIVEKIWYGTDSFLTYEVKEPGKYKVRVFAKDKNKKKKDIFTNEVTVEK